MEYDFVADYDRLVPDECIPFTKTARIKILHFARRLPGSRVVSDAVPIDCGCPEKKTEEVSSNHTPDQKHESDLAKQYPWLES